MMKNLFLIIAIGFCCSQSYAQINYSPNGPSYTMVQEVKNELVSFVLSINGVNGFGITACEENTGVNFYSLINHPNYNTMLFEYCLMISTLTKESAASLLTLFPVGSKYNDVYIHIFYMGPLVPQQD